MFRSDPNQARQRFYARNLAGGCKLVAFYNHSSRDYTKEDEAMIIESATKHLGSVARLPSPNKSKFLGLFVWVDIFDAEVFIGKALIGDQVPIGYVPFKKEDGWDGSVSKLCDFLKTYGETYWQEPTVSQVLLEIATGRKVL